jgi:hypothetical protein
MNRTVPLLLAFLMSVAGATRAADTASTKPTAKTTKAAKPSARGPGTQTEDELYIGAKAKTPQKAKPSTRSRSGDEDLEDLEIQRNRAKPR